jgi:phosphoglycerate kinase
MFKTLSNFKVRGKRVLLRCDFNVPLSGKGEILDDFRIRKTIPTIEYLIKKGAKVVLISHLGRPKGEVVEKLRLTPVQKRLAKYLDVQIPKAGDCIGPEIERRTLEMKNGEVLLLENLRFHKEEEKNGAHFVRELAKLGDIFINDAFSVCHRAHASVVGITKYLPSAAGFLLEKEVKVLSRIINPLRQPANGRLKHPLLVIIGGSKVEDKAKVVERFSKIADFLLIGNLVAKEIKKKRIKNPEKIILPLDDNETYDIGVQTIKIFKEKISKARTVFWAGPLGKIEEKKYQVGTREIAKAIIRSRAFSVIGGGDTIEFINKIGLIDKFNYVSVGGGAMLKFLAGEKLPGLEALK